MILLRREAMTIYVNRHPNYSYAMVILTKEWVSQLNDYISDVEWLSWNYLKDKKKPLIEISGPNHLLKLDVFLQRMMEAGIQEIRVRNERNDAWKPYVPTHWYSQEEMLRIETVAIHRNMELEWSQDTVLKCQNMLKNMDMRDERRKLIQEEMDIAYSRMEEQLNKEEDRRERLCYLWDSNDVINETMKSYKKHCDEGR